MFLYGVCLGHGVVCYFVVVACCLLRLDGHDRSPSLIGWCEINLFPYGALTNTVLSFLCNHCKLQSLMDLGAFIEQFFEAKFNVFTKYCKVLYY